MAKSNIKPKLLAAFLIMSVLLIIMGFYAISTTNKMQTQSHQILEENVASLKAAEELEIALLDMKGLTANYLLDGNETWLEIFDSKKSIFQNWFEEAKIRTHSTEEEILLSDIKKNFESYLDNQNKVINFYQQGQKQKAHNTLVKHMFEDANRIYNGCEELLFKNEKIMYSTSMLIKNDNKKFNLIMYGFGLTGILFGLSLGYFIAKSITGSIYELVLKASNATGDEFIEKIEITPSMTELEKLDKHIKTLIEKFQRNQSDLLQSRKMLLRSEKLAALGEMAAGLAHEIRNPLTAIKMLIFSIQNDVSTNDLTKNDMQIIIKEINRIESFLNNFLDYAKPSLPNLEKHSIKKLIDEALELMEPQLQNAQIITKAQLDADCELYIDLDQVMQVLINIIINSIQAMKHGGELFVEATSKQNENNDPAFACIKIIDQGEGIPPDMMSNIFNPFVTSKINGTGLGLSIAHQIIANHDGWIEAANNADKGAVISIYLPFKGDRTNE